MKNRASSSWRSEEVGDQCKRVERVFPLLTIFIAIIDSSSAAAIGWESARMKEQLKSLPGSNYLRYRRHRLG